MSIDSQESSDNLTFKTEYAVEMHCEACVKHIKGILSQQNGIQKYDIDLPNKRVTVEGKTSPSQVARALKADGRQVIVRGTGSASEGAPDGAAVCIFESYTPEKAREGLQQDVHGIARMVQVGSTTILDLTVRHERLDEGSAQRNGNAQTSSSLSSLPSRYGVYIARTGNISQGAASTGGIWRELGQVELRKKDGYGDLFTEVPNLQIWDIIGRAMVIAPVIESSSDQSLRDKQQALELGPGILAGVIARSAGAWTNDKTVCTCSGKTMWQEGLGAKI